MIGCGYELAGDLFDISNRIKEIDPAYFIVYSYVRKGWEVHHRYQRGSSLAFVVPFDKLDARTLAHARRTAVARLDSLILELNGGDYESLGNH